MRPRALRRLSVALALGACVFGSRRPVASAHGPAPAALSVLAWAGERADLVRLNVGLARRIEGDRFRFLCPASWGDERGSPAAQLADGTAVVAAGSGLFLLSADGTLEPHPDANARGASVDLVRAGTQLFALRVSSGRSEVVEIDARSVRTLWSGSETFFSIAAEDQRLLLLRSDELNVQWQLLDLAGVEHEAGQSALPAEVEYAFARLSQGVPYALVLELGRPELGRLGGAGWVSIAKGAASIAGPLAVDGAELLAVDGELSQLGAGALSPLAGDAYVSCVDDTDGVSFACTREGVLALSAQGTGEPLFALSQLVAPDLSALADAEQRDKCDYQWQDLRFDLIALGIVLPEDPEPAADAGMEPALEDAAEPEAGADAGAVRAPRASGGCSMRAAAEPGACSALLLAAGLAWYLRRKRRRER